MGEPAPEGEPPEGPSVLPAPATQAEVTRARPGRRLSRDPNRPWGLSCWLAFKKLFHCLTCHAFRPSETHPWRYRLKLFLRLFIAFFIFLICYFLWDWFKFLRPKFRRGVDIPHGNSKFRHFSPEARHRFRDLWPPEMTPQARAKAEQLVKEEALEEARQGVPPDERPVFHPISIKIIDLAWAMYGIAKELWQTIRRQGLQILGALCAVVLIFMHSAMIWHDFGTPLISKYVTAIADQTNDVTDELTTDSTCAYADGTGIANWGASSGGGSYENIAWFLCYHVNIIILCSAMIIDEMANVRVGLFAPQWTRAGNGWTLCFLSAATLSTSAAWVLNNSLGQLTYFLLICIFFLGLYNVFKASLGECGRPGSKAHREGYRVNRYPFWLWRGEFHPDGNDHLLTHKRPMYTLSTEGARVFHKQTLPRMNFREAAPHELVRVHEHYYDELHKQLVDKITEEPVRYRRHITENMQYYIGDASWPLDVVTQEHYIQQSKAAALHWEATQDTEEDPASLVWHVYDRELIQRWHMEQNKLKLKWYLRGCPFEMPRLTKGQRKEMRMTKKKTWIGLSNWKPKKHPMLFRWFDVRRLMAMAVALCMFVLQIFLAYNSLSVTRLADYRSQYTAAQSSWNSNGGPSDSDCAYYKESTVPIFVQSSSSQWKGVLTAMALLAVWHAALCGMCVGVFFVAWSNHIYYGMHSPIPFVTLIGCRMSSNSIGVTLGFVGVATLQLGFFFDMPDGIVIARMICYACIAMFCLYFWPNEYLRNFIIRNPLFNDYFPVSSSAMKWMAGNMVHQAAYDDYVPLPPHVKPNKEGKKKKEAQYVNQKKKKKKTKTG